MGDSTDPEPKDLNYRPQALARSGSVPALQLSRLPLWSISTAPVIPASASRLLSIPIKCWLSGCRQASPFLWVARRLMKGPGLYTNTEAHRWERPALGKMCPSTPIIFHQLEVAKPGCSQWTCSGGNQKDNGFPCPISYPWLRGTHPRGSAIPKALSRREVPSLRPYLYHFVEEGEHQRHTSILF